MTLESQKPADNTNSSSSDISLDFQQSVARDTWSDLEKFPTSGEKNLQNTPVENMLAGFDLTDQSQDDQSQDQDQEKQIAYAGPLDNQQEDKTSEKSNAQEPVSLQQAMQENQRISRMSMEMGFLFGNKSGDSNRDNLLSKDEVKALTENENLNPAQKEYAKFLNDNFDKIASLTGFREADKSTISVRDIAALSQVYTTQRTGKPWAHNQPGRDLGPSTVDAFQKVLKNLPENNQQQPTGPRIPDTRIPSPRK